MNDIPNVLPKGASQIISRAIMGIVAISLVFSASVLAESKSAPLEEVVVTALKREQSLLETPAAVTVFTPEMIENSQITRPADFIAMTPNISLVESNHAGETLITVRGDAQTRNTEAPVAFVIDGVVVTAAGGLNGELFDLQQIEVLKGPQGYLYGRNAVSGAIVVTTKEPTNEFEAFAKAGYGSHDEARAQFGISGAIIEDKLFARVSGSFVDREGYYRNETRGDFVDPFTEKSGRLRLIWKATDKLTADLRVALSEVEGGATNFQAQSLIPGLQTSGPVIVDANFTDAPFVFNVDNRNEQNKEFFALKLDYETDMGRFTSVSSYDAVEDIFGSDDFGYFPGPNGTQFNYRNHEAFSQEIRFTSPAENRFRYIVGGYFASIDDDPLVHAAVGTDTGGVVLDAFDPRLGPVNPTTSFISDSVENTVFSGFFTFQYDIWDNLELTVAGRFDHEDKESVDNSPPAFSATSGQVRNEKFSEFQPKVNLTWRVSENMTVYGGYAKGFKSGGFNGAQTSLRTGGAVPNDYPKEVAENFEIGLKTSWLDGALTINAAGFYNEKENSQVFRFIPAGTLNAVIFIDEIEILGGELEFVALPTENLMLRGSLGLVDAEIKEMTLSPADVGNRAPYVPEVSASLGATHTWPITNTNLTLVTDINYEHRGNQFWDSENTPESKRDALNFINGRVSLETDKWGVSFWVKNLTDEEYHAEVITVFTDPALLTQAVHKGVPRTFGVELSYRF